MGSETKRCASCGPQFDPARCNRKPEFCDATPTPAADGEREARNLVSDEVLAWLEGVIEERRNAAIKLRLDSDYQYPEADKAQAEADFALAALDALTLATPTPAADGEAERIIACEIGDAIAAHDSGETVNPEARAKHVVAALRARPLPDDVRAAVERVRRNLCGDHSDFECAFGDHVVETRDLRTLLAYTQRGEG